MQRYDVRVGFNPRAQEDQAKPESCENGSWVLYADFREVETRVLASEAALQNIRRMATKALGYNSSHSAIAQSMWRRVLTAIEKEVESE